MGHNLPSPRGELASEATSSVPPHYVEGFVMLLERVKQAVDEYNATISEDTLVVQGPILTDGYKIDYLKIARGGSHIEKDRDYEMEGGRSSPHDTLINSQGMAESTECSPKHISSDDGRNSFSPEAASRARLFKLVDSDLSSDLTYVSRNSSPVSTTAHESLPSDTVAMGIRSSTEAISPRSAPKIQDQAMPKDDPCGPRSRDSAIDLSGCQFFTANRFESSSAEGSPATIVSLCRSGAPAPSLHSQASRSSLDVLIGNIQVKTPECINDRSQQIMTSYIDNPQEKIHRLRDCDIDQQGHPVGSNSSKNSQRSPAIRAVHQNSSIITLIDREIRPVSSPDANLVNGVPAPRGMKARFRTPSPQRQLHCELNQHWTNHELEHDFTSNHLRGRRPVRTQPSVRWSPILPWSPTRKKAMEASWRKTLNFTTRGMDIANGLFDDGDDDSDG